MGAAETKVQNAVWTKHCEESGGRLFRNNVGVATFPGGQTVKYGLCVGSSDLIGWTPITITPDMVGRTVAVFTAFETKRAVKAKKATPKQINFVEHVRAAGGIAGVINDPKLVQECITDYIDGVQP